MKPGIFTFTPNPVLDLGGVVKKVIPDEKVYVANETRSPGGNGINAARIVSRLGGPVRLSGFLGGGIGEELKQLLGKEKLAQDFISISENTRIGITVSSLDSHTQTRFSFHGPKIKPTEKEAFKNFLKRMPAKSLLLIGGSLPPGLTIKDIKDFIAIAERNGTKTIVDCPGTVLKGVVRSRPLMIKPNLLEFQEMTGSRAETIESVRAAAKKLTRFIPIVCISSVENGALLVTKDEAWFGRIPKIKINSVVGAGDSMVGSMAYYIWQHGLTNFGDMLRWGLAASCASLSHKGTDLGQANEIKRYYKKTKVTQVGKTQ